MFEVIWKIFFACTILSVSSAVEEDTIISTTRGKIRGKILQTEVGVDINAWLGIPFASPPINELRFQKPYPIIYDWDGILETTEKKPECFQYVLDEVNSYSIEGPMAEDCLYLNVFVPHPKPKNAAVIVWLHGYEFFQGSLNHKFYSYETLAALENVVIVAPQFRHGILGYLYANDTNAPGNVGQYDQLMALQWVNDNIKSFGGDPSKVTLMGYNSGASNTVFHCTSKLAADLIDKCIIMSRTNSIKDNRNVNYALNALRATANYFNCSDVFLDLLGQVECLKDVPPLELVKADYIWGKNTQFTPIYEEDSLLSMDDLALLGRKFIIGSNSDLASIIKSHGSSSFSNINLSDELTRYQFMKNIQSFTWDLSLKEAVKAILLYEYNNYVNFRDHTIESKNFNLLLSDWSLNCPMVSMSKDLAAAGIDIYQYHLDISNTYRTLELDYPVSEDYLIFGNSLMQSNNDSELLMNVSRTMITYFSNFAKTG